MAAPGEKKEYITLISVISCIAVVFLHTNGCFWTFSTAPYWKSAVVLESLFYFAVPCFYMLTGVNLLNYRETYSTKTFFKKRALKTLIPFLFWSLVGAAVSLIQQNAAIHSGWDLLRGITKSSFVPIYWFFPVLFGLYLSVPLFAATEKKSRKEVFTYLAVAGFIINALIPFLKKTVLPELSWPFVLGVVSESLIFLVIGYLICNYEMSCRLRIVLYVCTVLAFAAHCLGTYFASMEAGKIIRTFKGYDSVIGIVYSVGIFTLLRYTGDKLMKKKAIHKIVHLIAPYTLSIYLLQYFIYTGFTGLLHLNTQSLLYRLGAPFIIIPLSIFITWIVRKIPVVRRVLP